MTEPTETAPARPQRPLAVAAVRAAAIADAHEPEEPQRKRKKKRRKLTSDEKTDHEEGSDFEDDGDSSGDDEKDEDEDEDEVVIIPNTEVSTRMTCQNTRLIQTHQVADTLKSKTDPTRKRTRGAGGGRAKKGVSVTEATRLATQPTSARPTAGRSPDPLDPEQVKVSSRGHSEKFLTLLPQTRRRHPVWLFYEQVNSHPTRKNEHKAGDRYFKCWLGNRDTFTITAGSNTNTGRR